MPSTKQPMNARAVAVEILAASSGPRKVKEVVAEALADSRSRKMRGQTPEATLSVQLYTAAKSGKPVTAQDGSEGVIVKADRGLLVFKRARARRTAS